MYHNTAAVLGPDGEITGLYRKMHIPDDPLYFEKYYFTPGDLGFGSIATPYGRLGVLVCWDQWYPEGARIAALSGADLLRTPLRSAGIRLRKLSTGRPTGRLAHHPARACHRQLRLRGRREPRGL